MESFSPLRIVNYPHPTLRHVSKPLKRVDKQIKHCIAEMLELMYEHSGVGLAANQVDLPFQFFVIDPSGEPGSGQQRILINPVVQSPKGTSEAEEGCLSIPNVYGKVIRPAQVQVIAYDLQGNEINEIVDGMLARVIQHEFDHLQGVLFPDRMTEEARRVIEVELEDFEIEFESMLKRDEGLHTEQVNQRLARLVAEYC